MATDYRSPQARHHHPANAGPAAAVSRVLRLEALERAERHRLLVELEDQEPECECRQTDVDLFDPAGCEYHDPESEWNVAMRAATPAQRYEEYEPAEAQNCPF